MTSLLEKAFEVASKLPTLEQNILARMLLDEIESEKRWDAGEKGASVELNADQ